MNTIEAQIEEIKSKITYIDKFKNTLVRAMNIRVKIAEKRAESIEILSDNLEDKDEIRLLERCIKNERWFLRKIEKGLEEPYDELKTTYHWINKNVKSKDVRDKTKRIVEIVEIFISRIDDIEHRLQLEEYFVNKQDADSFKEFVKQWNKEIRLNRKLLKKTVDASDLQSYFKEISLGFMGVITGGVIGVELE